MGCLNKISFRGIANGITARSVHHVKSWVGREHRAWVQVAPLLLQIAHGLRPDLISKAEVIFWCLLSRMVKLLYRFPPRESLEGVCEKLRSYVSAFLQFQWFFQVYSSFGTAGTSMKLKLHLLLHLPDQLRAWGSMAVVASEKYELFNAPIRYL